MPAVTLTRENTIAMLIQAVRNAHKMGAFALREMPTIKKAIDYLDPDVKEKPTFENNPENPEVAAVHLLLQCVQRGQAHGGDRAYSIEDAALLWEITEFWLKEIGNEGTDKKSGKSTKSSTVQHDDDHDDEDDDAEIDSKYRPITMSKGKSRA